MVYRLMGLFTLVTRNTDSTGSSGGGHVSPMAIQVQPYSWSVLPSPKVSTIFRKGQSGIGNRCVGNQ